ncbi:hypothetical protein RND71_026461 [Anisodus tanguticus]|uniref:Uncharacterized protein n=1 Tax=Anisodus tanguticus TaxID=243964 RepID=A0AAE1RNG1_9SOLA|nr:hypothetical protein RND71_026461 [Anisodus tanguticus]
MNKSLSLLLQMVSEPTIIGLDSTAMTDFRFRNHEPYTYVYHYFNGVLNFVEFSDGSFRAPSTVDYLSKALKLLREQRRILYQMISPTKSKEKKQTSNDTDFVEDYFSNSEVFDNPDEFRQEIEEEPNPEGVDDDGTEEISSQMGSGNDVAEVLENEEEEEPLELENGEQKSAITEEDHLFDKCPNSNGAEITEVEIEGVDVDNSKNADMVFAESFLRIDDVGDCEKKSITPKSIPDHNLGEVAACNEDSPLEVEDISKTNSETDEDQVFDKCSQSNEEFLFEGEVLNEGQASDDIGYANIDKLGKLRQTTRSNGQSGEKEMEIEGAKAGETAKLSNDKLSSVDAHVFSLCTERVFWENSVTDKYSKHGVNWFTSKLFVEVLNRKLEHKNSKLYCRVGMSEIEKGLKPFMLSLAKGFYDFRSLSCLYEKSLFYMNSKIHVVEGFITDVIKFWIHNPNLRELFEQLRKRDIRNGFTRVKWLGNDLYSFPLLNDLVVSKCALTDCSLAALSYAMQVILQVFVLPGCSTVSNKNVASFAFIFVATKELCQQGYSETGFMIELRVPQSSLYILLEFKAGIFDYFIVIDASKYEGSVYELKKEPNKEELDGYDVAREAGKNWEYSAQNEINPFKAATIGYQGFLLVTYSFVIKEIIGATLSLLLEDPVDMVGSIYLLFECSKAKGTRNLESLEILEADVKIEFSGVNIVEMSITVAIKNLTWNCFGAVLNPTWAIHVAKLLKCYPFSVVRMIMKLVIIGSKMLLALPLLLSSLSVSSLKLKSESATPTCLLEGENACAKVCYGAFAPVEISYNAELSYKLEPITKHMPEAFYKQNGEVVDEGEERGDDGG